jgi:hypothetical protein
MTAIKINWIKLLRHSIRLKSRTLTKPFSSIKAALQKRNYLLRRTYGAPKKPCETRDIDMRL